MSIDLDKYTPSFWRSLKIGQTVGLTDEQGIMDAMKKKDGVESNYIIKSIRDITDEATGITWLFFNLESNDNIWLLVKIVGEEFDLRIYFEPADFEQGNRADMIEKECFWMFNEPEDPENFELNDLVFAKEFELDGFDYKMKSVGILVGNVKDEPYQEGINDSMACVVEYQTDGETDNPEVMFIEIGGEESEEGGLIYMLMGTPISQEEIIII